MNPRINIIAAIGQKTRVLGKEQKIPWHIPEDFKRFKDITTGHAIIMGRKTYESIGKPLPNRINIVITRNKDFCPEGVITSGSLEEAIGEARKLENDEIYIIGGGQIYAQAIPLTERLRLTLVSPDDGIVGDTYFPEYPEFSKVVFEEQGTSSNKPWCYTFMDLERR